MVYVYFDVCPNCLECIIAFLYSYENKYCFYLEVSTYLKVIRVLILFTDQTSNVGPGMHVGMFFLKIITVKK